MHTCFRNNFLFLIMAAYPITIRLLVSLSKKECDKFNEYLNSSYFNKIETLPKLYNLISQEFKSGKKIYSESDFVQKTYGEQKLRKYKFDLQKLKEHFERFIVLQQIEKEERLYNQIIVEDYLHRKNGCFFEQKFNRAKKCLNDLPRDIYYYQHLYKIEELLHSYIIYFKDKRVGDTNLQAASDSIDWDFILKKLFCLVLMHNRQNIAKANYHFGFETYVIEYLKNMPVIEQPLINLFYQAYQILTGDNKNIAFEKLNLQLEQSNPKIAKEMVMILFIVIQNNLKRIIEFEANLHQQLFDLYNIMINQIYIQTEGKLPITFFRNVVSIALELGEYDYVEQFIEDYKYKLFPEKLADSIYLYNKAKFLIYTKKPEQARTLIANLHFDDAIYKFDLKCLQIMVFYELKAYSLLESLISNFRIDLTPNRPPYISEENTLVYRNFIYAVNKLYQFSTSPNTTKNDIQNLVKYIKKTNQFSNRKWLLVKANEFA